MSTVSHFYLLTVQAPMRNGGNEFQTVGGTVDVVPGVTREAVFQMARGQLHERLRNGNVLFFAVGPNKLMPAESPAVDGGAA